MKAPVLYLLALTIMPGPVLAQSAEAAAAQAVRATLARSPRSARHLSGGNAIEQVVLPGRK